MQPLQYTALEALRVPRPVDRLAYLESRVRGKRVFDLGALDETAFQSKKESDHWLHARLCAQASAVVGLDNSRLVPEEGLETVGGNRIINADIFRLDPVVDRYGPPDVIIAGELIEHLPNTEEFLASLRENPRLKGIEFVFSTPNACCWHNLIVGLAGRESMHVDHLQVYSYKTLRTLFRRADIDLVELVPCHARFYEMIESAAGVKKLTVSVFQHAVNVMERLSPILSAGWIGVARL